MGRQTFLAALAAASVLGVLAWTYGYLVDQREAAAAAADSAAECRKFAGEIEAARHAPLESLRPAELTRSIARAAADAGLADGALERIEPGPVRRAPDGSTSEKPVAVYVRAASLRQLVTFLYALSSPPDQLRVARLRLTPADESTRSAWAVETTLTYATPGEDQERNGAPRK